MDSQVHGVVRDGLGQGREFTQLDWVRQQFRDKVGFDPCPGTLNVSVQDSATLAEWRASRGIELIPTPGFCAARCYRVRLNETRDAAWIIPDVPGYPNDLIEIMAPVLLRDALELKTGDFVSIRLLERE